MNKLALHLTAISLLLAGSASAADMRRPAPYKAPPPVAPIATYNWTGCYVGAGGGYGMFNQRTRSLDGGFAISEEYDIGGKGWFGTVQVGCDYQINQSFVIGAFADYDFGNIKSHVGLLPFNWYGTEKLKWSWAAGGRIGYLPFQQLMVFVSGGYTQANFGATELHSFGGGPVGLHIAKNSYEGWFIGTGYEYTLGWFPGLTWKTEYRFADYGSENVPLLTTIDTPSGLSLDSHKYVHTVRSELVWRFNFGGGPVVARY